MVSNITFCDICYCVCTDLKSVCQLEVKTSFHFTLNIKKTLKYYDIVLNLYHQPLLPILNHPALLELHTHTHTHTVCRDLMTFITIIRLIRSTSLEPAVD